MITVNDLKKGDIVVDLNNDKAFLELYDFNTGTNQVITLDVCSCDEDYLPKNTLIDGINYQGLKIEYSDCQNYRAVLLIQKSATINYNVTIINNSTGETLKNYDCDTYTQVENVCYPYAIFFE